MTNEQEQGLTLLGDIRLVVQAAAIEWSDRLGPIGEIGAAARRILEADHEGRLLGRLLAEPLELFAAKLHAVVEAATREVTRDDGR